MINLKPAWLPIPRSDRAPQDFRDMVNAGRLPLSGSRTSFGVLSLRSPPVSVNLLYSASERTGERMKTEIYEAWLNLASAELTRQPPWHVSGKFRVRLQFNQSKTRADLDNLIKPVLDLLQNTLRISSDRHAVEVRAQWSTITGGTKIELWNSSLLMDAKHG